MAPRPRLVPLAAGLLLLGALNLGVAAPALAGDDPICATKPENCGPLTIRISGYVAGNAYADNKSASQVLSCHHEPSATTNSCTGMFNVIGASRLVQVRAVAVNPTGITTCIGNVCGLANATEVVLDITVTVGGRATANVSFTKTDGHTVTVTKGGTGTGTVTSDKGGISCGSVCTWGYFSSELVVLTATPTGDSTFTGWSDSGTCVGQDETCHLVTGKDITTQAIFSAPKTPPPASPSPSPSPSPTPTKSPPPASASPSPPSGPNASAGHSAAPTIKPPPTLTAGGASQDPGGTTNPGSTQNDIASLDPTTADPNLGPTPTPFKFATDEPNRTDIPLNELPSIGSQPTEPAGAAGSGPPWVVIGLIAILGALVGGGVFWWARRRNAAL